MSKPAFKRILLKISGEARLKRMSPPGSAFENSGGSGSGGGNQGGYGGGRAAAPAPRANDLDDEIPF